MWGDFANSKPVTSNTGYIEEGNVKKFKFTENAQRVRFLTEDIDVEQIMSDKHMTRDEAVDYINREIGKDRWLAPKPYWEHTIKSIPNQRFFSTVVCRGGKNGCPLCAENDKAKETGVTENKFLPYPIRKRFICPVYVYDLKMVLYVVGAEDFYSTVGKYIEYHGSNIDFELSKKGQGFDTVYNAFFIGKATEKIPELDMLKPCEIDMCVSDEEIGRRVTGAPSKPKSPVHGEESRLTTDEKPSVDPKPEEKKGEFVLPFGTHKGKTFKEVEAIEGLEYIKFLAENSVGVVQLEAEKYINK